MMTHFKFAFQHLIATFLRQMNRNPSTSNINRNPSFLGELAKCIISGFRQSDSSLPKDDDVACLGKICADKASILPWIPNFLSWTDESQGSGIEGMSLEEMHESREHVDLVLALLKGMVRNKIYGSYRENFKIQKCKMTLWPPNPKSESNQPHRNAESNFSTHKPPPAHQTPRPFSGVRLLAAAKRI
jgi:hypothetical protein